MSEPLFPGEPLVETAQARRVFCELFQQLYHVSSPILPLARVMHWALTAHQLGVRDSALNAAPTQLLGGFFYNTSTPAPGEREIDVGLQRGRARGATQFLVPTVRNTAWTEALRVQGFIKIPWFIECVYEMRAGLDADLRVQLGRRRYKDIVRLSRKAAQYYDAQYYEGAAIQEVSGVLDTVAALHEYNSRKYSHPLNLYDRHLLQYLCESPLAENLLVCIRRDRMTGESIQASISLIDRRRLQMYQLAHGIRHEAVRMGNNLDIADTYDLCKFAEGVGIREINFGRGMANYKRRVGANRFILLNNWLLTESPDAARDLELLVTRVRRALSMTDADQFKIGGTPVL